MINKKSLWFLTLFSLILVLSIYYITMPSELLLTTNTSNLLTEEKEQEEVNIDIEESDLLVALRVESDEKMTNEIEELQLILTNADSSVDEKNKAYEKIKELNDVRGEEEKLESQVKENYKLDAFIKINGNQIQVTINSSEHSNNLANNIMRTIQANYKDSKYITVKFQK
ncbi:MAG: SpoIIIAH-like family protein [Bacilli bacterium]|nr:SpoIIIAH-like family protein [Bacilli bacterium]